MCFLRYPEHHARNRTYLAGLEQDLLFFGPPYMSLKLEWCTSSRRDAHLIRCSCANQSCVVYVPERSHKCIPFSVRSKWKRAESTDNVNDNERAHTWNTQRADKVNDNERARKWNTQRTDNAKCEWTSTQIKHTERADTAKCEWGSTQMIQQIAQMVRPR